MGTITNHPGLPRRILVVDDEAEILEVLSEYLSARGFEVHAVASGREALERVNREARPYDLALVDWNLPGIAGRDVITDLEELSPSTPVVVVTGSLNPRMSRKGVERVERILTKPFSLSTLGQTVDEILASRRARICG